MKAFEITIPTNIGPAIAGLKKWPGAAIAKALDKENELTVGHIQLTKLSRKGSKTLGVITNRLRQSLRPSKAVASGSDVVSSIGTNVWYAGIHEFGFQGTVQVRQFTRHNPHGDMFRVGAETAKRKDVVKTASFKTSAKLKKVASGFSVVKAHSRQMNMPERAMIRTGIQERTANYGAALGAAWKENQ
jgi:phage gpG-like protein